MIDVIYLKKKNIRKLKEKETHNSAVLPSATAQQLQ